MAGDEVEIVRKREKSLKRRMEQNRITLASDQ
jgi:hypothetical protein